MPVKYGKYKRILRNWDEILLMTDGIIKDRSHEKEKILKSLETTQNKLTETEIKKTKII